MWLAFHDDLADPENEDPVLRQSTRLTCIAPSAGPTSLEVDVTQEWLAASITIHPALSLMFGVTDDAQYDDPEVEAQMAEMGIECVLRCPSCEGEDPYGHVVTFLKSKLFPAQE